MKAKFSRTALALALACVAFCNPARAVTNVFFSAFQTATVVTTNMNSATIRSGAYLFTYTTDGFWSASPGGPPTGRFQPVLWPAGVDAQAITTGPLLGSSASITVQRVDGLPFDLQSFTGKLLGNTAGAGAAFELMPQLKGQDAFQNPLTYDATGIAGNSFTYAPALTGYDTYIISLWIDFALTQLTVADASAPPLISVAKSSPIQLALRWPTNCVGYTLQQDRKSTRLNSSH